MSGDDSIDIADDSIQYANPVNVPSLWFTSFFNDTSGRDKLLKRTTSSPMPNTNPSRGKETNNPQITSKAMMMAEMQCEEVQLYGPGQHRHQLIEEISFKNYRKTFSD
ncbi:hypothetical protein TorRG33x02_018120 [Trema orientale]|uniref:Uncharacterized protein n=1 Tax=Trema orientale TaxID=63057 RepID=A0A2P5FYF9_TREOI|nr:hypothetical protein TorRG33x02_018120 [Trema orientale]